MKPFPHGALSSARLTRASFNVATIATIVGIAVFLFVAIYAMTLNPIDATVTIGIPP